MALDGLNSETIDEAYKAAFNQEGGWFLLRYTARNEVDLLSEGNVGFEEAREAITRYEEKSPLYGWISFHQRKVLLQYIPEGTSRLLQGLYSQSYYSKQHQNYADIISEVRLTVHSQEVAERFSHDAIVSITTPSELNDTTLSSAIDQGSNSLSSVPPNVPSISPTLEGRKSGISKYDNRHGIEATIASTTEVHDQDGVRTLTSSENRLKSSSNLEEKKRYVNRDKSLPAIPTDPPEEPASNCQDPTDDDSKESFGKLQSVQSIRPVMRNSEEEYGYRPKVKLGPRPSLDYGKRPNRANSHSHGESRLVSTLPAGVRMPARKAVPPRPQSQQSHLNHNHFHNARRFHVAAVPTVVPSPAENRPSSRSGSIRSLSTLSHTPESKPQATALEKQRLMKALQIRQKQMARRILEESSSTQPANLSTNHNMPSKVVDDEATLRGLDEVSPADGECDIVHVGMKDLSDALSTNPQASPVSIPEPSDGPSTQASSIADAEEPGLCNTHIPDPTSPDSKTSSHSTSGETEHLHLITNDAGSDYKLFIEDGPAIQHEKVQLVPHDIPLPESSEDEETLLGSSPNLAEVAEVEDQEATLVSFPNQVALPKKDSTPDHVNLNVNPILVPSTANVLGQGETRTERMLPGTHVIELSTHPDHKAKRRGLVNPIQIGSNPDNSDDNFLSDDSFIEELQSATVEEAKPISVSRSPITPVFPRSPKSLNESPSGERRKSLPEPINTSDEGQSEYLSPHRQDTTERDTSADIEPGLPKASRSMSNPLDSINFHTERHLSPKSSKDIARRSVSISPTPIGRPDISLPISKKVGVSTGISQRIKALEKFTSSPTAQASLTPPTISPDFVNNRKTSIGSPTAASNPPENTANRNFSFRRKFPYPTPTPSPQATNKLLRKPDSSNPKHHDPLTKPQPTSISVTARIVRDAPNQKPGVPIDLSEPSVVKLHQSPLVVEHQTSTHTAKRPSTRPMKSRPNSFVSNSSSSPEFKRETPADSRRDSSSSRPPVPSRKGSDADPSNALSESSCNSQESTEGKEEKKISKRSKLFKRMSSMSSSSRRSIVHALSPSVKVEDPIPEHQQSSKSVPQSDVDLGDLNTQFPDTLVRRQ